MRIAELKEKEVINVCDGEKLGNVCDIGFHEKTGQIISLIVPGPCKVLGILGRDQEYIIPFCDVLRIGTDVVLVEVDTKECLKKCDMSEKE